MPIFNVALKCPVRRPLALVCVCRRANVDSEKAQPSLTIALDRPSKFVKCLLVSIDNPSLVYNVASMMALLLRHTMWKLLLVSIVSPKFDIVNSMDVIPGWANSYCAQNPEWLCAEFVARALHVGGVFGGGAFDVNWNGYSLIWVCFKECFVFSSPQRKK